jgi:protein-S-isoprenylcysteine O-methyltransferase Ste14
MPAICKTLARYRVPVSLLFVIAYLIFSKLSFTFLYIGLPLIIAGESLRIWASGYLHKATKLTTSGPYALIRNPLYAGNFLLGLGFILIAWHLYLFIFFALLFVFLYYVTIKSEEERLQKLFGKPYLQYKQHVPSIIPRLHPYHGEKEKFKWTQVMKNREYRAIIGITVLFVLQLLKTVLIPY